MRACFQMDGICEWRTERLKMWVKKVIAIGHRCCGPWWCHPGQPSDSPEHLSCERKMAMRTDGSILHIEILCYFWTLSYSFTLESNRLIRRTINALPRQPGDQIGKFRRVGLILRRVKFPFKLFPPWFVARIPNCWDSTSHYWIKASPSKPTETSWSITSAPSTSSLAFSSSTCFCWPQYIRVIHKGASYEGEEILNTETNLVFWLPFYRHAGRKSQPLWSSYLQLLSAHEQRIMNVV